MDNQVEYENVFLVYSYIDNFHPTTEPIGIFSSHNQAYNTVLEEMRSNPRTESGIDAYFIEEWEVNGGRVNVHRYDNN